LYIKFTLPDFNPHEFNLRRYLSRTTFAATELTKIFFLEVQYNKWGRQSPEKN